MNHLALNVDDTVQQHELSTSEHRLNSRVGQKTVASKIGAVAQAYARRGIKVFPCKPKAKAPLTPNGFYDATNNTDQIAEYWRCWSNANIGVPTGPENGLLVIDVDEHGVESLEVLESKYGKLPVTRSHRTGSGGKHLLFRYPAGEEIRNSAGSKLGTGLDIRGMGGYIVAPPSCTTKGSYKVLDDLPLANPPEWLLERLRETRRANKRDTGVLPAAEVVIAESSEPIPEGQRDNTLTSIAGRLHDGSRTLAQLEETLLEINESRCSPPLDATQVRKIARSIHPRTPCHISRSVTPEVIEALNAIGAETKARECKSQGDHTDYDIMVALERRARKYGGVMIPGGVRVTVSFRQIAEEASIGSTNTVSNSIQRLKQAGRLRQDGTGYGPISGALVMIIPPRAGENTKTIAPPIDEEREMDSSVLPCAPPSAPRLRWSSPGRAGRLGKIRGRVVDTLESTPNLTLEEIASRLDYKRARDLRRRTLGPLMEAGVVVCTEGRYSLAPDWREALDKRREEDGELEAAERQRERHERSRKAFRVAWKRGEVIGEAERRRRERWRALRGDRHQHCADVSKVSGLEQVSGSPASPKLSPQELEAVEAVVAWERERGPFDFSRAAWKLIFYTGPISGVWPDSKECERVAAYMGRLSEAA